MDVRGAKAEETLHEVEYQRLTGISIPVRHNLFAHENDRRYSISVNSFNDRNLTVSQVCFWIAKRKVLCFEPEMQRITRSQFGLYPPQEGRGRVNGWKDWWKANRKRGLARLQIEAIDAEIAFFKEVDGRTAPPWHAAANPLPIGEFNRIRDINLRKLSAIRKYIDASETSYRPSSLMGEGDYLFGLPWTTRRHNR